ncbi:uncharacterized protein YecT (DUF1311 family) [Povalibacter uvarum]|uniref:Uncharacterized protein YecT (DUF1311 family) n=1 Tax=Povalibacter uvarum TaxID=732238 RepID=A0A841HJ77_9GAMM|nr:lysozyme inhibitor LprI family protein [Povalibacter uvarum]MBB6092360.1 uncharacterized protein YecT (DUF1311 family) [Povalibacter uvarum]
MRVLLATGLWAVSTAVLACERNEYGVFEDIACAAEAVENARKEMESVLDNLAARLDPEVREALEKAQAAWSDYREAAVQFVYAQEGGSSGRLVVANDTERAIRARTEELKQWQPQ